MTRHIASLVVFLLLFSLPLLHSQEELLRISARVVPAEVAQGEDGSLLLRITPQAGIQVSAHPELMVRLDENERLSYAKMFFAASEFNFPTVQAKERTLLNLNKEIEIPFKVHEDCPVGRHTISGDINFTVYYPNKWYVKRTQKFSAVVGVRKGGKKRKQ